MYECWVCIAVQHNIVCLSLFQYTDESYNAHAQSTYCPNGSHLLLPSHQIN